MVSCKKDNGLIGCGDSLVAGTTAGNLQLRYNQNNDDELRMLHG